MTDSTIRLPTKRELIQEDYPAPEIACRLNDYGHDLGKRGHYATAAIAFRRAVAMAPDNPVLLSALGAVLYDCGEFLEAESILRKSISIEPNYAPAYGNLGSVLCALNRHDEVKPTFLHALEIEPDYTDARWNLAMCLLDAGRWSEAWPYYESRKERGSSRMYPKLPYSAWRGEDLNGKTLHVQGEQGVGDRTLFSRYMFWIKQQFPDCKINYQMNAEDLPNISNFMWGFRDVVEFIPNGVPWPEADYGIYLMSIPGIHESTPDNIVDDPGLILKNAMKHKNSVSLPTVQDGMLKVGITWTGNPGMKRNSDRSVPFEMMLELAQLPNVVLYGLQIGTYDINRVGADGLVCDLTNDISPLGFAGTAATMLNLDLVISACTATAHVAGVLDVPCWTLLCANPYWLWLRDRNDSIWYKNTKLFRQAKMNDWRPVIDEVKEELLKLSSERYIKLEAAE